MDFLYYKTPINYEVKERGEQKSILKSTCEMVWHIVPSSRPHGNPKRRKRENTLLESDSLFSKDVHILFCMYVYVPEYDSPKWSSRQL